MRKPSPTFLRRSALTSAAVLIFVGFTMSILMSIDIRWWPWWPDLHWIRLPYHDWRIRVRTNEISAVCIRTYIGIWFDVSFHPRELPSEAIFVGNLLLLPFTIEKVKARIRRLRWRAGFCRECNYNLTANTTGICPECGTSVEIQ